MYLMRPSRVLRRANPLLLAACLFLGLAILDTQTARARPFAGPKPMIGLGLSLHHHVPASEQSLHLSYRNGDYGLISAGLVSEAGYRFDKEVGVLSMGAELWLIFVGLRVDAVVESGFDASSSAVGIAYRASFGIGPKAYINLGGQTLFGHGTEFISAIGFTLFRDNKETKDDAE